MDVVNILLGHNEIVKNKGEWITVNELKKVMTLNEKQDPSLVHHFMWLYSWAKGVLLKCWSRMEEKQQIANVSNICLVQ